MNLEKEECFLSGASLKVIALITMLIDHIGSLFFPQYLILRIIGRVSFPIFCFLLVEGFVHTKNIKKYALRLGAFALISEIPFDLTLHGRLFYLEAQNVFFTLFIGLIVLMMIKKYNIQSFMSMISIFLGCIIAVLLKCDYSAMGILLIAFMYIYRGEILSVSLAMIVLNWIEGGMLQAAAAFALVPIAYYNGKRGIHLKYVFYVFYPVHLLILYFIKVML